jgi:hypothetical protein
MLLDFLNIQGDSGGKVSILGGDNVGHCDVTFIWTCVKFWMVTEIELFESTNKKAMWMVMKKEKLLQVNFNLTFKCQLYFTEITNLLQFTINVPKSHRQPQCTLQLVC